MEVTVNINYKNEKLQGLRRADAGTFCLLCRTRWCRDSLFLQRCTLRRCALHRCAGSEKERTA